MFVKLLLRRADNYSRLEMFEECVRDYTLVNSISSTDEIKRALRDAQKALKMSKRKDYYKILAIDKNSSDKEVFLVNIDYESV